MTTVTDEWQLSLRLGFARGRGLPSKATDNDCKENGTYPMAISDRVTT
jgi:hypothetical protein